MAAGSGRPVRGPHPRDITAQTRTPAGPGAAVTAGPTLTARDEAIDPSSPASAACTKSEELWSENVHSAEPHRNETVATQPHQPDDRKYREEDKKSADPLAFSQADAQGPHETPIRAGEERILTWTPKVPSGDYTVRARLIYDLNRYNDPQFTGDQTEIYRASLAIKIAE